MQEEWLATERRMKELREEQQELHNYQLLVEQRALQQALAVRDAAFEAAPSSGSETDSSSRQLDPGVGMRELLLGGAESGSVRERLVGGVASRKATQEGAEDIAGQDDAKTNVSSTELPSEDRQTRVSAPEEKQKKPAGPVTSFSRRKGPEVRAREAAEAAAAAAAAADAATSRTSAQGWGQESPELPATDVGDPPAYFDPASQGMRLKVRSDEDGSEGRERDKSNRFMTHSSHHSYPPARPSAVTGD